MNVRSISALAVLLACFAFAPAQLSKEKTEKSRQILNKVRQIDHLNHILPLALTSEQIKGILPAIEKARANEDKVTLNEHNELVKLSAELDAQIEKGTKKGAVPDQDFNKKVAKLFSDFGIVRSLVAEENTDLVFEAVKKVFNAGQLKVAANTLDPKQFDPTLKPDTMSEDEKVKFFVKAVFMDWTSYEILVKLSAR